MNVENCSKEEESTGQVLSIAVYNAWSDSTNRLMIQDLVLKGTQE
jgi:hypothetical protein